MKKAFMAFLVCCFAVFPCACEAAPLNVDSKLAAVVLEQDAENPKWSFGNGEVCYEIGINREWSPVFKDPEAAFAQFIVDYEETLDFMRKEFHLHRIDSRHWMAYGVYGIQIVTEDEELRRKGSEVSYFIGILENSFQIVSPDQYA